jgi:hypothetical protein
MADLADIQDPRVTTFRALIARIDKHRKRNDRRGADLENRAIAGDLRDLISDISAGAVIHEIYHAEARDSGDDDASPISPASMAAFAEAGVLERLRGTARVLELLMPAWMSALDTAFILNEFIAQYAYELRGHISPGIAAARKRREAEEETSVEWAMRRRFVLLANYLSGRDGGSWVDILMEKRGMGRDAARRWGDDIDEREKKDCRQAGKLRRKNGEGAALLEPYAELEGMVLRYEVRDMRTLHGRFKRGDFNTRGT